MNRLFSLRANAEVRSTVSAAGSRRAPAPRESVACESYEPGHQMHYIQQGQALRSPSVRAERAFVDGDRIVLVLGPDEQLEWRHHDLARLRSILDLFPSSRVVYHSYHALRVGPYWFNCTAQDLDSCPPPQPDDEPVPV